MNMTTKQMQPLNEKIQNIVNATFRFYKRVNVRNGEIIVDERSDISVRRREIL